MRRAGLPRERFHWASRLGFGTGALFLALGLCALLAGAAVGGEAALPAALLGATGLAAGLGLVALGAMHARWARRAARGAPGRPLRALAIGLASFAALALTLLAAAALPPAEGFAVFAAGAVALGLGGLALRRA